jgi:hypothetical protein
MKRGPLPRSANPALTIGAQDGGMASLVPIGDQIGALAAAAGHCPLAQLVEGVDAVRRLARTEGLGEVAMLASRLESAIAERGRSAIILSYLDAMAAALTVTTDGSADAGTAANDDAWLASIAVRFAN